MGREVGSGGRVIQEPECPNKSLRLSLPKSCQNLISIFKSNPADFGRSQASRWSEVDAESKKVAHWGAGGVCQISNKKYKK
jgi:hypothetical protein